MLGTMQYDTRMFGQDSRYTVCVNNDENFNLYEALNKAICNIRAQMTDLRDWQIMRNRQRKSFPLIRMSEIILTHSLKENFITGKIQRW